MKNSTSDNPRKKLTDKEKEVLAHDLFERYRLGKTTEEENKIIESLEVDFIPEKDFELTDELINEMDLDTKVFIFKHAGIDLDNPTHRAKKRELSLTIIASIASIALLVIGIFLFYKPQYHQTKNIEKQHVATSAIKNITLADGSEIILNSGTTLRETSREVWLEEGEVFFNVKPNNSQPFIVHLRDGLTVKVVGTSFTIQSYAELSFQEVSVLSGNVNVSTPENKSLELAANQQATYYAAKKELTRESINSVQKAAWRTGTIVLESASADELSLRIRQLYGKEVVFENQSGSMSINMTLDRSMAINEIADEIAALYDLTYRIADDKIVFQSTNVTEIP